MKLRIVGDGTIRGTKVFTESGIEITGIKDMELAHYGGHLPIVSLTSSEVEFDVLAQLNHIQRGTTLWFQNAWEERFDPDRDKGEEPKVEVETIKNLPEWEGAE